ncbi:Uncharacterized conserved protein YcfJ, contains glycine zipper 2TM domain [Pseudoxanthomonas sp. GM95]|uniref:hypothetical protein n=1 Tax=Pseudoxanthomonas sp. GM95 TaxID=1881043 RepID=UPI0008B12D9B|nr:hypothetical protein [Pseudoxanthomonas sp. GM95]SEL90148.1 Uncharacterized conserved protein YcfJ, contains glycine zipper 2TM domain [Pseudoxanthomonas sp. GM95]
MPPVPRALLLVCLSGLAPSAFAQQATVVPMENVRIDYAQVLSVDPVYQVLRATRTEQQCDEPADAPKGETGEDTPKEEGRIARMVDSVKGIFGGDDKSAPPAETKPSATPAPPATGTNCRMVTVEREFRRPIAYDVDYVYKGTKYRSRLAEDPGNRLRIRVSVMPYAPGQIRAGNP